MRTNVRYPLTERSFGKVIDVIELPLALPCGLLLRNRIAKASLSETLADAAGRLSLRAGAATEVGSAETGSGRRRCAALGTPRGGR
jgi:hypothetical protein